MDTRHPDEGTIHAYVERQLSPAEQARVEAHVAGCAECAASVSEARGLIAAASRIVAALDDVPARVIPVRPTRRLPLWLATAAVMVLAVGVSSVAVRSGLDSRRSAPSMTGDAAGEQRQAAMPEVQASAAVESAAPGQTAASVSAPVATGSTPPSRRETAEIRSSTVATAPEPARKRGGSERAIALSAPMVPSQPAAPAAPAAPPASEADFSGADAGAVVGDRTTGAAAPTGRISARAQAAPTDAAALSLRQSRATITGRVLTENGQPLVGANVFISEFNISVSTDAAGRYALTIPSDHLEVQAAVVRARAVGYAPQAQLLNVATGSQTADFELRPDRTQLSELTVAGGTRGEEPVQTILYEAAAGVIVELREFRAASRIPAARPGVNEYRWSDAAGSRRFVLSGSLPVPELRELAARLGELRVVP